MHRTIRKEVKMTIWIASLVALGALLLPSIATGHQHKQHLKDGNISKNQTANHTLSTQQHSRPTRSIQTGSGAHETKMIMGDSVGLDTALDSRRDLMTAAGEHKKYILVKKKPKHKKIKMEVYKPKMKYKKIKMKVPVKKMKKKKVKGYLVKKEKHYR